jgi:hypothetical protein
MNPMLEKNKAIWEETNKKLGESVVKALVSKGYKAYYFPSSKEAAQKILEMIPSGSTVGVPGTCTVREIGLMELLAEKGCTINHHWDPSLSPEERKKKLQEELLSDYYITSTNALTTDGTFVNIDGTGNRVAGMAWGTNKLIFVVGINKICPDIESAIKRVHNVATPPNAIRLNYDVPCTKLGYCVDCNSPNRVCRATLILDRAPFGREIHVFIIGEALGY